MPAVPQTAMTAVLTYKIKIITGSTPTELGTNVDAQTNTLNKLIVVPAIGQTTGGPGGTSGVLNGSIVVTPLNAVNSTQNVVTYLAAVTWQQYVIPS